MTRGGRDAVRERSIENLFGGVAKRLTRREKKQKEKKKKKKSRIKPTASFASDVAFTYTVCNMNYEYSII